MDIKGYKNVSYRDFQKELHKRWVDANIPDVNLAASINVKSVVTVRNIFNTENQVVSDEVFTKALSVIGVNGCVVWINGVRNYYINYKN